MFPLKFDYTNYVSDSTIVIYDFTININPIFTFTKSNGEIITVDFQTVILYVDMTISYDWIDNI